MNKQTLSERDICTKFITREEVSFTDDADTMFEYCEGLRKQGRTPLRVIKLQAAFSLEHFTPDGQKDFPVVLEDPGEYQLPHDRRRSVVQAS